ncbi:diguanylate cyclase (GGDEF) domain [Firmicutes bacterium CAG:582]|nr:diguanylate cyclase (GGDEF) domain [Firmicutes bacterium CAG:582]
MDIRAIVENIPNMIASLYESIYVINKNDNKFYDIKYTGEELRISSPLDYDKINDVMRTYKEFSPTFLNENEFKKVLVTNDNKEKLVTLITVEEYKIIFVVDITMKIDGNVLRNKIIIADDSPVITNFFSKIFRNEFEVIVAHNGKEVIDIVNQYMNDSLVGLFLDLQMPVMNGFEVLDYFKEHDLFKIVPVSIISGEDTEEGIKRAMSYQGVIDMIQKPFDATSIRAIVDKTVTFSPKYK